MVQHDMSLKDSEIDDLRRDNLKLFEKIRFLQSYSSQVRVGVTASRRLHSASLLSADRGG